MDTYVVLNPSKLQQFREKAGYSQEAAAALCHISRKLLNHFETGYARPTADTLLALCYIYNIPDAKELMFFTDNPRIFRLRDKSGRVTHVENAANNILQTT